MITETHFTFNGKYTVCGAVCGGENATTREVSNITCRACLSGIVERAMRRNMTNLVPFDVYCIRVPTFHVRCAASKSKSTDYAVERLVEKYGGQKYATLASNISPYVRGKVACCPFVIEDIKQLLTDYTLEREVDNDTNP